MDYRFAIIEWAGHLQKILSLCLAYVRLSWEESLHCTYERERMHLWWSCNCNGMWWRSGCCGFDGVVFLFSVSLSLEVMQGSLLYKHYKERKKNKQIVCGCTILFSLLDRDGSLWTIGGLDIGHPHRVKNVSIV